MGPPDEIALRRLSARMLAAALRVEAEGEELDDLARHPLADAAYAWLRRQSGGDLWTLMDAHGLGED
jgi:hypothetical protein